MSNFDRFKERNKIRANATVRSNSTFIFKGYNSTLIKNGTSELQAAVVNQQEKDSAYIYTQLNDHLQIGSCWEAKTLHFLITEEIITIKDVEWHKYLAVLCNINLDGIWGRFIGPEEKYVATALKQDILLTSQQKPIIILPSNTLNFGDKVIIKNRPWLVQEYDNISTPGITYYSLSATTVSNHVAEENQGKDFYIERANNTEFLVNEDIKQENEVIKIGHNMNITLATENGYFKYDNANIKVLSRKEKEVIFNLPFGVDKVNINVQKEGEVVSATYVAE